MSTSDRILWGIHAGRNAEADELFLKQKLLGLGWSQLGDLSKLPADRTAFKTKVRDAYPNAKDGAINNWAGQLFRFVHEMKPGDFVAYPSKTDRQIHLGKVEGPYRYDPKIAPKYFNVRDVRWLKALPRSHFTQGALYEIGSALSLFQIKNYADEFYAAMEGKAEPEPVKEDESVPAVVGEIEENTQAWVIGRLAQETKGHPFAHFVAHLLNVMGYRTRVSPEGPDGGVDIVAHKDELGFEPPIIKVQCKSSEGTVRGNGRRSRCLSPVWQSRQQGARPVRNPRHVLVQGRVLRQEQGQPAADRRRGTGRVGLPALREIRFASQGPTSHAQGLRP